MGGYDGNITTRYFVAMTWDILIPECITSGYTINSFMFISGILQLTDVKGRHECHCLHILYCGMTRMCSLSVSSFIMECFWSIWCIYFLCVCLCVSVSVMWRHMSWLHDINSPQSLWVPPHTELTCSSCRSAVTDAPASTQARAHTHPPMTTQPEP